MSNTYYKVLNIIKEIEKRTWNRKQIYNFILFVLIISSWVIPFLLFQNENRNFLFGLSFTTSLIFTATLIILMFSIKSDRIEVDKDEKISILYKGLNLIEIDNESKILNLQKEILKENHMLEKEKNNLFKRLGKTFLYVFWIPSGFLMAYFIKENPQELPDFSSVMLLIFLLFQLTGAIIGLVIMLGSELDNFLVYRKRERLNVYRCLEDVRYKYYLND